MTPRQSSIPIPVVKLLVGFFSHTNNESEKDELDEWICLHDDNMKVFEDCLEISVRTKQPHPEMDEETATNLYFVTSLILKHNDGSIDKEEKEALDEFILLLSPGDDLFKEIPATLRRDVIHQWLVKQWVKGKDAVQLN